MTAWRRDRRMRTDDQVASHTTRSRAGQMVAAGIVIIALAVGGQLWVIDQRQSAQIEREKAQQEEIERRREILAQNARETNQAITELRRNICVVLEGFKANRTDEEAVERIERGMVDLGCHDLPPPRPAGQP